MQRFSSLRSLLNSIKWMDLSEMIHVFRPSFNIYLIRIHEHVRHKSCRWVIWQFSLISRPKDLGRRANRIDRQYMVCFESVTQQIIKECCNATQRHDEILFFAESSKEVSPWYSRVPNVLMKIFLPP